MGLYGSIYIRPRHKKKNTIYESKSVRILLSVSNWPNISPVLTIAILPHETIYNQPPSETGFYMIFPAVHGCFTSWGLLRGPIMIRKVAIWIQMAPRTDRKGCLISNRNHCACLIMFHKHITFLSLQSFPADLRPPSFQFYSEEHNNR